MPGDESPFVMQSFAARADRAEHGLLAGAETAQQLGKSQAAKSVLHADAELVPKVLDMVVEGECCPILAVQRVRKQNGGLAIFLDIDTINIFPAPKHADLAAAQHDEAIGANQKLQTAAFSGGDQRCYAPPTAHKRLVP